jgi:hypothetical protein
MEKQAESVRCPTEMAHREAICGIVCNQQRFARFFFPSVFAFLLFPSAFPS